MSGFDCLGALTVYEHIGATARDHRPVVSKLSAAASRTAKAASKLHAINPRAAQRLSKLSAAATTAKSTLQKAADVVKKTKAAATKPTAKAPARPSRAPASPRVASPSAASSARRHVGGGDMSVVMIDVDPAVLAAAIQDFNTMSDVYMAFATQVDDAGVAAEVIALVQPLLPQVQAAGKTDLVTSGNSLVSRANSVINNVQPPGA